MVPKMETWSSVISDSCMLVERVKALVAADMIPTKDEIDTIIDVRARICEQFDGVVGSDAEPRMNHRDHYDGPK